MCAKLFVGSRRVKPCPRAEEEAGDEGEEAEEERRENGRGSLVLNWLNSRGHRYPCLGASHVAHSTPLNKLLLLRLTCLTMRF